jgi:hypothetical protein
MIDNPEGAQSLLVAFIGYVPTGELLMELGIRQRLAPALVHPERNEQAVRILTAELRYRQVTDEQLDECPIELQVGQMLADFVNEQNESVDSGSGRGARGRGSNPPGAHGPAHDDSRNYPTDGGYGA